jgi:hypothetical protein
LKISVADLALNREYFLRKDERYEAYKNFQVDLIEMLGSRLSRDEIKWKMARVLEFENLLANVSSFLS